MTIDRSTLDGLHMVARRERAHAIHDLLIAPLFRHLKESLHAARSHFAAAGS